MKNVIKVQKVKKDKKPYQGNAEWFNIKSGRKILARIYSNPMRGEPLYELNIKGRVSYYSTLDDCVKSAEIRLT